MLFTRNAFYFRKFYKEEVARERGPIDLNFVGSLHPDKKRNETGFSKLIYGNREDLGKLLGTIALNVAADDQAIYELIQNADDCKSSFFSVSYNENYLLCINNGNYFSDRDMSAIINVAGNYKDGEDIGTFGIGFKIIHRLVGADDGREAIINDYAGPIIFSWNKFFQLNNFLNDDEIKVGFDAEKDIENPWLIKLLYTCFPSHLDEKIKLQDYDTQDVKFSVSELSEMRAFLKLSLQNVNLKETNNLKSGSIFFLKLGKGKSKFLDDGIDKIKSGLSYSFKFLNSLNKIYINGEEIKAQPVTHYSYSFPVNSKEFNEINPKNKNRDIKFTFAYYRDYQKAENLRNELAPNLYTFFSMDEEKNGFSFLLHCNAFDMNNDRRKLQANSQINEKLLPVIAENITQHIDNLKGKDDNLFLSLYANLLLSKEPKSKPHINNNFFRYFQNYILENIPTYRGYANNPQNVKIKDTFLEVSPSDFGCPEIEWFCWNNEKTDNVLIIEARKPEKLNLEKWSIIDLIKYAVQQNKIVEINNWIKKIELETSQIFAEEKRLKETDSIQDLKRKSKPYYSLLSEINKNILKSNFEFVAKIKLFKFSDGNFYSLSEIFEGEDLVLNYEKTFDVRYELQNIGLVTSVINIDSINSKGNANYSNIKDLLLTKLSDLHLFQKIATKVKLNNLRKEQKHKLFVALEKLDGVGVEKLRDLELFKNSQGDVYPLRNLLKGDLSVPNWLFNFKIHIAEYTSDLDKYLVQEEEIYQQIIYPDWENIILKVQDINNLYEKTVYYYGLKEDNKIFRTQKFVYTKHGFLLPNQVFFNSEMAKLESQYVYFQNIIQSLFDLPTPERQITQYLLKEPFKIDGSKFCGRTANNIKLDVSEIKSALSFCKFNNEQFFKTFIIKKSDNGFVVVPKTNLTYQITTPDNEARKFIDENCKDRLFVLPIEFFESKDDDGIVKADDLHSLILEFVDADKHKETLVDIVKYKAKYKFLQELSEFRFNSETEYTKEDYEYKILDLACSELKINDYQKFKNKVVIETENQNLKLTEIPPFTDKIKIDDYEISLAKILPDNYENSDHLSSLINQFIGLGLNKERIGNLFGVSEDPEPSDIFQMFSEQVETLENAEQLAFLFLYGLHIEEINFNQFKALNIDEEEITLGTDKYLTDFDFIQESEILHQKYRGVTKIYKDFPIVVADNDNLLLIKEPYFEEDRFICPYIKDKLTDEEKLSFVEFLFIQWNKKSQKTVIKNIVWSKIDDIETENILGFNPRTSVYPSKYASESEVLPDYLIKWIGNEENKIDFLSDLGVWTENSVIVELRKFLSDKIKDFYNNRLAQETRFNEEEANLFNSFEWLKEKEITLKTAEQFETFKKLVEVINENRTKNGNLEIKKEFDFEELEENAIEWEESYYENWKEESEVAIFLYEGELPKTISLDEIEDFVFYNLYEGNTAIDDENNIYVNRNADVKKELRKLELENDNYNFDGLWQNKLEVLEKENAKLRRVNEATLGTEFSTDISKNDQKEANREAKEIVKEKLEREGFEFTEGIGRYSTIDGVFKDDIEFPLVVKSYKYQDEPLKIGANEWIQLMKPNSMFWLHFGNRKLGCLKLYELLRNQDKLTLSFSTENLDVEDRLQKFAELLHYFGNVHFDFNSVKPSDYSVSKDLSDYRFDERRNEEDLSGDDESIL